MNINTTLTMKRESAIFVSQLCMIKYDYDELLQLSIGYLHHKEIQRLEQFPSLNRKHSYLLGRVAAKKALKKTGQQDLSEIFITNGVFNQPIFNSISGRLSLSISHSMDVGAALIFPEEHPMAIDIEFVNRDNQQIISRELLPCEQKHINKYENTPMHILLWTAKEALAKVLKTGMMLSLDILEINEVIKQGDFFISTYKNFYQYKAVSKVLDGNLVLTIVCPMHTSIDLMNLLKIK